MSENSAGWLLSFIIPTIITGGIWLIWKVIKYIAYLLLCVFAYIIGDNPEK